MPRTRIFDVAPAELAPEPAVGARIYLHVGPDELDEPVAPALAALRATAAAHAVEVTEEIIDVGSASYGLGELLAHCAAGRCSVVVCFSPPPDELSELRGVELIHPAPPVGDDSHVDEFGPS